jgi:hypothetical protein
MISRTARRPSLPAKAWRDGTRYLPGMLFSTFQLRLKRIHRAKRKFCGSIHVCNAWLKLQKILPGTFFIRVRVSFVAHMATIARSGWLIRKKAGCRLVDAASPQRPILSRTSFCAAQRDRLIAFNRNWCGTGSSGYSIPGGSPNPDVRRPISV